MYKTTAVFHFTSVSPQAARHGIYRACRNSALGFIGNTCPCPSLCLWPHAFKTFKWQKFQKACSDPSGPSRPLRRKDWPWIPRALVKGCWVSGMGNCHDCPGPKYSKLSWDPLENPVHQSLNKFAFFYSGIYFLNKKF